MCYVLCTVDGYTLKCKIFVLNTREVQLLDHHLDWIHLPYHHQWVSTFKCLYQSSSNAKAAEKKKQALLRRVDWLLTLDPGLSLNNASAEVEVSPSLSVKCQKDCNKLLSFRFFCMFHDTNTKIWPSCQKNSDENFCSQRIGNTYWCCKDKNWGLLSEFQISCQEWIYSGIVHVTREGYVCSFGTHTSWQDPKESITYWCFNKKIIWVPDFL